MLPLQATFTLLVPARCAAGSRPRRGASVAATGAFYLLAGWISQHTRPAAAVGVCAPSSASGDSCCSPRGGRRRDRGGGRADLQPTGGHLRAAECGRVPRCDRAAAGRLRGMRPRPGRTGAPPRIGSMMSTIDLRGARSACAISAGSCRAPSSTSRLHSRRCARSARPCVIVAPRRSTSSASASTESVRPRRCACRPMSSPPRCRGWTHRSARPSRAIRRARLVHEDQRRAETTTEVVEGTVTERWVPVDRVGLYVPGAARSTPRAS